jgi:hypothetical protein
MKWYNKEKTRMLDLDSINGFVMISAKEVLGNPSTSDQQKDFEQNGDRMEVIIGGSVFVFRGDQANELYNILTTPTEPSSNGKQVIHG